MKPSRCLPLVRGPLSAFLALILVALVHPAPAADEGFKSLFNGHDLAEWDGLPGFWSVRDGAITGQTTTDHVLPANTFLIWQGGDVANFELRLSFRLVPNNDRNAGNSGIQYRSKLLDAATRTVGGYQADIDSAGRYLGMIYEEKGRGIMMRPGQHIRIGPAGADGKPTIEPFGTPTDPAELAANYRKTEWNDMVIIANGNHIQQFVNGKLTGEAFDNDAAHAATTGILALQLHVGPPMTIQFKDVMLKTLP